MSDAGFSLPARVVRRMLHRLILGRLGAGQPVPPSALDREYASGAWDHFSGAAERPRYDALLRLVRAGPPRPRLLDIGCGSGEFARRFAPGELAGYLGVDLSAEGLRRASALGLPATRFERADFETWRPAETFDAIVFNEVIGYARRPGRLVRDFAAALAPGGRIYVSYYRDLNHAAIWRQVLRGWTVAHAEVLAGDAGRVWDIRVLTAPTFS